MELHPYQEVARDYLLDHDHAGLFLDMGLGKTATALTALNKLPALVVAPKQVAEHVWPVEKELWRPDLSIALAAGTAEARRQALSAGADITVISRDNLADAVKARPKGYPTVILDELSSFKNMHTNRWKAARKLVRGSANITVWGLTGTPAPNGLMDLWAQIALLDAGERLGRSLTAFRNRYFVPVQQLPTGQVIEWKLRPEAEARIHSQLEDLCLSMNNDESLPPVTHNQVKLEMPARASAAYKEFAKELVTDLRDLIGGEVHSAANAAVLTNKLSQVSAGLVYDDEGGGYTVLHREKLNAVSGIVAEAQGNPVIVFYRYNSEKAELLQKFPQARTIASPGAVKDWNAGRVPVLLAHPASAGHGLNLQHGGHTVVWTSLPWSLEEWEQANRRLVRQGQKHPVVIHSLMARGTLDNVIALRLRDKTFSQEALMKHLEASL
jgi:SNF2 family DNA or RNA helicase